MWLLLLLFAVLYGLGLRAYEEGWIRDLMRTLSQPLVRVFVVLAVLFGFKFAYNLGLHYLVRYFGGHIIHDWNSLLAYTRYREDLGQSCLVPGGIEEQYIDRLTLPAYYFNRRCVGNQAGYANLNQVRYWHRIKPRTGSDMIPADLFTVALLSARFRFRGYPGRTISSVVPRMDMANLVLIVLINLQETSTKRFL